MKRRQLITRAGAAALSGALAACGAGSDPADSAASRKELGDAAAGKNPASDEIAAGVGVDTRFTIPTCLVQETGQYQVEVVFKTQKACSVVLHTPRDGEQVIATKEVTNSLAHKVGFALYQAEIGTNRLGTLYFNELATATDAGATTTVGGSPPGVDAEVGHDYAKYEDAYEGGLRVCSWTFYSKNNFTDINGVLGYVRFYEIPASEINFKVGVAAGRFILPIVNDATANDNPFGSYPKLHDDTNPVTGIKLGGGNDYTNLYGVESSTLADPTGENKDCVILPDTYVPGVEGIVPTFLAASNKLKPLLRRRMRRHALKHGETLVRKGVVIDDSSDIDVHHLVGNEVLRLLGGEALIKKLKNVKTEVLAEIESKILTSGDDFHNFCQDHLEAEIYRARMPANAASLLDIAETTEFDGRNPRPEEPVTDDPIRQSGGGMSCSLLFQLGGSFSYQPNPLFGGRTPNPFTIGKRGFELSLGLAKAGVKWVDSLRQGHATTIKDHESVGYKAGFTIVIKLAEPGNLSGDVKVTFGMTFKGNGEGHRLDFIQIDPVFDIHTHRFVNMLTDTFLSTLMSDIAKSPPMSSKLRLPPLSSASSLTVAAGSDIAKSWTDADAGVPLQKEAAKKVLNLMRQQSGATSSAISTLEYSPLRFYAFNQNVNNPSEAFIPGGFIASGRPPVWAWQPGIKYIVGGEVKVSTPPSATVQANGFMRVVAVLDGYYQRGTVEYLRAAAHSWSYA